MALRKNVSLVFLAMAILSVIDAMDVARSELRAPGTTSLENGIPDGFHCKGPSRFSLDQANTKMLCGGKLCLVQCKPGYKSLKEIPFVYVCHGDGLWTSIPFNKVIHGYSIEWPVCYYNDGF